MMANPRNSGTVKKSRVTRTATGEAVKKIIKVTGAATAEQQEMNIAHMKHKISCKKFEKNDG